MYYILYGVLYIISLIPFTILYFVSDGIAYLLQHLFHYREEVIHSNLKNAFPEKNEKEILAITKQFYRNLTNSMVETIKLLSLSKRNILKRGKMDVSEINAEVEKGRNIQFHSAHLFGWEYLSLSMAEGISIPFIGIYMQIKNNAVSQLFLKIRGRTNAILMSAAEMPKKFPEMHLKQYAMGFIADQNPPNEKSAYWLNFFNRPVPFLTGPEKFAERNDTVIFFIQTKKIKRGYYEFTPVNITGDISKYPKGELTRNYRDYLEKEIRRDPANYLWSHRRWKYEWNILYQRKWVDANLPPS